jgi:MFS family permease
MRLAVAWDAVRFSNRGLKPVATSLGPDVMPLPPAAGLPPRLPAVVRATYVRDRTRGICQGWVESCTGTFALLIAIRYFAADESIKTLLPAAGGLGLICSPLVLAVFSRLSIPYARLLGGIWWLIAGCLFAAALVPALPLFVVAMVGAGFLLNQSLGFMTTLYTRNYPSSERGSRLSTVFVILSLSSMTVGYLGGIWLDFALANYRWLFAGGGVAALIAGLAVGGMPSDPANQLPNRNPWHNLRLIRDDRLFAWTLGGWMLMGMGNLMLIPARIEYLANPIYGLNLTNTEVSTLLLTVVMAFRLLSTKVWGYFFDRVNLFSLRLILNLLFMASIVVFFNSATFWTLAIGCALLGVSFGGGGIMWSLFVTKLAPRGQVSAYMSVHSFLTGLRSTAAPFLGYAVLTIHPTFAAWVGCLLIGLSTLVFLPLRRAEQVRVAMAE